MKPKLLVFTSTFPRWQNDTDPPFVYELSRRLTDTFDITVHTPHYPGAKTRDVMERMNIHRFRYFFAPFEKLAGSTGILPTLRHNKLYYGLVPFFLLAQFFSLLLLVRKFRPDIIHAHWIIPQGFVAVLVQVFSGVPVVVTAHGADILGLQGALFKTIKRFTLARVERVSVVSRALVEALTELISHDIQPTIIPMGVDATVFSPDKRNDLIRKKYAINGPFLLYVGRLTEKKGVGYLIDAMPLVLRDVPTAKLLIVGSGELEEVLKKHVVNLGLVNQIRFVGGVVNKYLPEYYATADIFIGPSIAAKSGDTEGFGLTFVEAALSGCLIVGTNIGGIGDIIQDEITGLLVPQKNTRAIADRIIYGLYNRGRMENIRKKASRRCAERFDWAVVASKYTTLLKTV